MKDIGYYIYHNCKNKSCPNFPIHIRMTGEYTQSLHIGYIPLKDTKRNQECPLCAGCDTYKKAMQILK